MRLSRKGRARLQNKNKKSDNRKTIVVSLSVLMLLCHNLPAYAYTVDDLRELQGKPRLDTMYKPEEKSDIWLKWYRTEYKNRVANMLSQVDKTKLIDEPTEARKEIEISIEHAKGSFVSAFVSGSPVKDVLSGYTSLNTELYRLSQAKEVGEYITLEVEENIWTEMVKEIERIEKEIASYKELGSLGTTLRPPVQGNFVLTSLYGVRQHPVLENVEMHRGIDIAAVTGTPVHTVWAGVVLRVYESERGGKTVEVDHGSGLITRYLHLDSTSVKEGQTLRQYEVIATAGATGVVTGAHLHFEVHLDGESVDPLYFFGKAGANALRDYLSRNIDSRDDYTVSLLSSIKDPTTGLVVSGTSMGEKPVTYERDAVTIEGSTPLVLDGGFSQPAPSGKILDLTAPSSPITVERGKNDTLNTSSTSSESSPSFDSMTDFLNSLEEGASDE